MTRLLSRLVVPAARRRLVRLRALAADPEAAQRAQLSRLLGAARRTHFGRVHGFDRVRSPQDYQRAVPLRDYGGFSPWWERARRGEPDVTWPGRIRYWAISSGTTSGEKYLPVSRQTIRTNRAGGFDLLVPALAGEAPDLLDGRLIFLGGATTLRREGPTWIGDNSGIMARHIPWPFTRLHSPGPEVAAERDWDRKIPRAVDVALGQDIRMLGGLPSWLTLFAHHALATARFRGLRARALLDLWPNLRLIVHGGTSFAPYRTALLGLVGADVRCTDSYSASEGGMLGLQDLRDDPALLPVVDQGVYFEFVPVEDLASPRPTRLPLHLVEPGVDYAVAVTTDSGIWAYFLGDAVRFVSVRPFRFLFAGRTAHMLNAFGEHVSGGEMERAVLDAAREVDLLVREFAVAAVFPGPDRPRGRHLWFVEPDALPTDAASTARAMALAIDRRISAGNEDYTAHRSGGYALDEPEVRLLPPGTTCEWMRRRGRLGGQNKVPRVLSPELAASLTALAGERASTTSPGAS